MNKVSYLPLTFVSTADDIKRHITNTIIMKHVIESENTLVKLEELLEDTQYGYTASAQQVGSHRLLRITDIQNGDVNWEDVPFCDCERPDKYIVKKGDILVARTGGTTGKSFLVTDDNTPENVVYASYLIKLRVDKERLLPEYLNVFMNSYVYWSQITEMKAGSAQPNVNANKLKELMIPYCSIKDQKNFIVRNKHNAELNSKIIKVCNQFDKVKQIEILTKEQEIDINLYRDIIVQNAIQGKLVQQDENDEPASVLLERIKIKKENLIKDKKLKKAKPLPKISDEEKPFELPKGWEWARIGEVIEKLIGGGTPSKYNKLYWNGEIKWASVKDMNSDSLFIENTQDSITREGLENSSANLIPKGTLILCTRMGIGKINFNNIDLAINQDLKAIFLTEFISKKYFYFYYKSLSFKGKGTTVKGIRQEELLSMLLPIPPFKEQLRIVEKIEHLMLLCDELEANIEQSKQEAEKLMKAVLQDAFTFKEEVLS